MFGIGWGGVPTFVMRALAQHKESKRYQKNKILVCIFQRGAMDGLMAVTPFTDSHLKEARPNLFMSADSKGLLLDLDGKFGLHPGFKSFLPLFQESNLAIVHGMGSPNNTRSHFDAQDYMESGTPFSKGTPSGWLNRAVGLLGHEGSPLRSVSLTSSLPRSLYGDNPAIAITNIKDFSIQRSGKSAANLSAQSLEELYDQTSNDLLKETGKETFEAVGLFQKVGTQKYTPAEGVEYPNSPLGNSLRQICQLIKMDVGLEVAFAESGGWDTHVNQGTGSGQFARNAADLSTSMAAFWKDLGNFQDSVTVMTMTEFGRTVKQNGTGGTDHGRASCMFILGHEVNGGRVHGTINSLASENLEEGRDLPVTTDFRSVFSEVADKHLGISDNSTLFPGWSGTSMGVMK
jgi:uncharacterized protein (DUF1501 family)